MTKWLSPLVRMMAALAVVYTHRNDFIGRLQVVFAALVVVCLVALIVDLIVGRRDPGNKRFLAAAAVSGGLFYVGKLILFSTSEWVVYLISPASIAIYHIPALIFISMMVYPWLGEKSAV